MTGHDLAALRIAWGLSQRSAARLFRVSIPTYRRHETRGSRDVSPVMGYAALYLDGPGRPIVEAHKLAQRARCGPRSC